MHRLLLVDDDPLHLRSLARVLSEHFECTSARTVDEAIAAIDEHDFDAVLADVRMPDGGGVELARRLRARNDRLAKRVVLLTGMDDGFELPTIQKGTAAAAIIEAVQQVVSGEVSPQK